MISFDPLHPKTGTVIELLAEHESLSATEIIQRMHKEKGLKLSKANFYKILGKMIENQLLVKSGEMISLNMVWVSSLHKYATQMHEQSMKEDMTAFPPLKEGERRTFKAESLEKIDPIWTHGILYFFTQQKDRTIFVYQSHPWFILGRPATERRLYDSCHTEGKQMQMLYGNTSFLDRYGTQLHKTTDCPAYITDHPPFPKEGYNLWLCGDCIIECFFSDLIGQYFSSFFSTTMRAGDFDLKTFSSIFGIKVPAELHISRDKKKAETLRKKFIVYCKK